MSYSRSDGFEIIVLRFYVSGWMYLDRLIVVFVVLTIIMLLVFRLVCVLSPMMCHDDHCGHFVTAA